MSGYRLHTVSSGPEFVHKDKTVEVPRSSLVVFGSIALYGMFLGQKRKEFICRGHVDLSVKF